MVKTLPPRLTTPDLQNLHRGADNRSSRVHEGHTNDDKNINNASCITDQLCSLPCAVLFCCQDFPVFLKMFSLVCACVHMLDVHA